MHKPSPSHCSAGVWAAGDKWHYAPLAHCLARLGVLACVVSYSLYPDALVPEIVQEVSAAFDWAMEHVEQYGGDRQQVTAVTGASCIGCCYLASHNCTALAWRGQALGLRLV